MFTIGSFAIIFNKQARSQPPHTLLTTAIPNAPDVLDGDGYIITGKGEYHAFA
jgi:hypothetical protein